MILKLETTLPCVKESEVGPLLVTPATVENYLADLKPLAQEVFCVIALDAKHHLIERHLVSLGTVSSTLVHPRECFRPLILSGASACILGHNHPSGQTEASAEDIKITKQLISAGQIIGIKVLDHVIVGRSSPGLSLREAGLCRFE
jgi:DNA repair protein RadC